MRLSILLLLQCSLFCGCTSFGSAKKQKIFFKRIKGTKKLESPCINLPFVDRYYPEKLVEVTRIYNPKVDAVGSYRIALDLLRKDKKEKNYVLDTKSLKLCKQAGELGYSFKALKVR